MKPARLPDRPDPDGVLEPLVQLVCVRDRRLGHDHRELVAADAAGDVRRPDDVEDPVGGLGQHRVAGEMADPVVDRLEVVEVEHDEREGAAVAVGAGDLARERLVEVAAVVQPGESVEIRELARLAEAARVVDRRPGPERQLLDFATLASSKAVAPAREYAVR